MRILALCVTLVALCAISFGGTISTQTTPAGAQALASLAGGSMIDFEGVAPGKFASLVISGVTFTPDGKNVIYVDGDYIGQYNNFGRQSLHNNYSDDSFGTLTMAFSSPVSAFGFFWGASDTQWTLKAYDSGDNLIESFNLPITGASNAGDFVGLVDPGIAKAVLAGDSADYIFLDDLIFTSGSVGVPEPGTVALLGVGIAALAFLRRRAV